jgi:hypothetical protein
MFTAFSRSRPRYPTIRQALVQAGLSGAVDPTSVAVQEQSGQYSGRRVTYFRAFEPGHQDLLLASGHVEDNGQVVVNTRRTSEGQVPDREPAVRADHADDERLVFWDPASAQLSQATVSAQAVTWQQARSTEASDHG